MTARRGHRGGRGAAFVVAVGVALLATLLVTQAAPARSAKRGEFNDRGNVLIADQFNNRVIEVNPANHKVVWSFGDGSYVAGPHSVVGVNDAERIDGGRTLIAGTGTPAGADPSCPVAGGCPDNRVMIVNQQGKITWQYGQAGVTGDGPNQLNTPVQATALPDGGHVLITDQGNQRVIEVNHAQQILWQYGQTGVAGSGPGQLNNPNSAELLANGHILIADESNNRVIEVNRDHKIVATFTAGSTVSGAAFASRLPNGDTLITDSNNNRAVEVNRHDTIVWQYATNTRPGSYSDPLPTRALRLRNGDTLIADQFNDQVIEVTPASSIVWSQGTIDTANSEPDPQGFNLLNAPYDAKAIGDYTGLTPPPGNDH
jgi:hypothetical protein